MNIQVDVDVSAAREGEARLDRANLIAERRNHIN
jgi:hypothetical protein